MFSFGSANLLRATAAIEALHRRCSGSHVGGRWSLWTTTRMPAGPGHVDPGQGPREDAAGLIPLGREFRRIQTLGPNSP